MRSERTVDVLVAGGGPAGATASTLLARAGIEAVVLDPRDDPAPPVGLAIPPHVLPYLDQLGAREAIAGLPLTRPTSGLRLLADGGVRGLYLDYSTAALPAFPHGYAVASDQLAAALLDNAAARGVEVLAGVRAVTPIWEDRRLVGVAARGPAGEETELRCRVLLDASGRSCFLASRMGWRFPYPKFRRCAAYAWFEPSEAGPSELGDQPTVLIADRSRFWLTPFADRRFSAGVVVDVEDWRALGSSAESVFQARFASSLEAAAFVENVRRISPFGAVQGFPYRVLNTAGDGYCMIGDAAGFLDPAFPEGVIHAVASAASAAQDVVDALMRRGRVTADDFAPTVALSRSIQRLGMRIGRALRNPTFKALLFEPAISRPARASLESLVAGDVVRPGHWLRSLPLLLLIALAGAQSVATRVGRPFALPFTSTPSDRRP